MSGLWRMKEVKTRKNHSCECCNKPILAGSIVDNANGIAFDDDGKAIPYNYYFCQKCIEKAAIDAEEESEEEKDE